jgi:hypothetical protein
LIMDVSPLPKHTSRGAHLGGDSKSWCNHHGSAYAERISQLP